MDPISRDEKELSFVSQMKVVHILTTRNLKNNPTHNMREQEISTQEKTIKHGWKMISWAETVF